MTYAAPVRVVRLGVSVLKGAAQLHPDRLVLDALGPVEDRRYALVDAAAARVLRTVENSGLLGLQARVDRPGPTTGDATGPAAEEVLVVDVPGHGRTEVPAVAVGAMTVDYWGRPCDVEVLGGPGADRLAAALEAYLGRPSVLVRAGRRDVVYGEGVTLVTTSSLLEVERRRAAEGVGGPARELPALLADAERWRAALVVDTGDLPPFVEDTWHGHLLHVGTGVAAVTLRVTAGVARCAVVRGRPRTGGREDWDPLRLLAPDRLVSSPTGREVAFAVGAEVVVPGEVRTGDELRVGDRAGEDLAGP